MDAKTKEILELLCSAVHLVSQGFMDDAVTDLVEARYLLNEETKQTEPEVRTCPACGSSGVDVRRNDIFTRCDNCTLRLTNKAWDKLEG